MLNIFRKNIKYKIKSLNEVSPIQSIFQQDIKKVTSCNKLSVYFKDRLSEYSAVQPLALKKINNVKIAPALDFMLNENQIMIAEHINFEHHGQLTAEFIFLGSKLEKKYHFKVDREKKIATLSKRFRKSSVTIQEGINLIFASNNYWHFLVEEAPKIILSHQFEIPSEIPFIVANDLHPNLYQIIDILNRGRYKRNIIKVPVTRGVPPDEKILKNNILKIKNLYHFASHLNMPMHTLPEILLSNKIHGTYLSVNTSLIEKTVNMILSSFNVEKKLDPKSKIFLKRVSNFRVSKDEDKLINYLSKKGFKIVDTSKLSIEEQVKIFSNASCIVGFSGAAFTNTLFAHENCKKILFANKTFYKLVSFWDRILNNLYVLENEFISKEKNDIHGEPYLTKQNWADLNDIITEID